MRTIGEYQNIIFEEIEKFQKGNKDFSLYEPVNYILDIGGKRLRPVLTLLATDLFAGTVADSIKPALGIEGFIILLFYMMISWIMHLYEGVWLRFMKNGVLMQLFFLVT